MKINDRVIHEEFGSGVVVDVWFEDTPRETYLIKFDKENYKLHNGSISDKSDLAPFKYSFCNSSELKLED